MIQIKQVSQSDQARWQELFKAYGEFYKVTLPQETIDTTWDWITSGDEDFWCAVARDEAGAIVGFTQYQFMHRSLGGSKVCYLSDLFVDPAIRSGGVGRALIDYVIAQMAERGVSNVRWLTAEDNLTARKLYDSYQPVSGFVLYSVPVG
ncbi:MAG: GNAT family N-acetyltransferase [Granulosicoccaceae bacterium]